MVQLEQLIQLFDCDTAEIWGALLVSIARECGYSHSLFGIVPSKSTPFETAFLKSNYPALWRSTYEKSQLHQVDPTVTHCLNNMLPIAWDSSTFVGRKQKEFYEEASVYGLRSGISFPIHGASGEFGVLSFISTDTEHLANSSDLSAMANLCLIRDYAVASSLQFTNNKKDPPSKIKLTSRELECIKWIMNGKSSWEIARILSCSEATINFHVSNLLKKFNVHTRQQAVVIAIKNGLIFPA
jgi:LuxR family quorum-sensing transcriptional regulator LasR